MTHHIIYISLKIAFLWYHLNRIFTTSNQLVAEINLYGYINKLNYLRGLLSKIESVT